MPDQAQFGEEYFLVYMLPDFKLKILTQLLDAQKGNGLLLFNLMGQCFQGVGPTKWTSVILKQCPSGMLLPCNRRGQVGGGHDDGNDNRDNEDKWIVP